MDKIEIINRRRKRFWTINALCFHVGQLSRKTRDKNIWVFSAWDGMKYADNSKYLFEFVIKHHPEISCYWQTRNIDLYHQLIAEGIPTQLIGSKESRSTQRKAGVAVYTHGVDDFGTVPLVYGAQLVCLWHGASFKKTYRLQLPENRNIVRQMLGNAKWDFFNYMKQNITVATSDYSVEFFYRGFRLKNKSGICKAGQARNDGFSGKQPVSYELLQYIQGRTVILYMPTFREDNKEILEEIVYLFTNPKIQDLLTNNNCVLLCKLHYLVQANIQSNNNCKLLNDKDVPDVQQLQLLSDMLITDYSGSGIDYALLRRPIMFYFPDWEQYHADTTMMPDTKEICNVNCAWTHNEFVQRLSEMIENPERGLKQAEKLNQFFNSERIPIGEFCEKNFEEITKLLK